MTLYEATFEPRWVTAAVELADVMLDQFWDENEGGFFYTGRAHEVLIARNKDPHDNAIPSGNCDGRDGPAAAGEADRPHRIAGRSGDDAATYSAA